MGAIAMMMSGGTGGGGSPPSLPVSGASLWLRADTAIFTDQAGTTPATSNGDPVRCWKDQSGNGYNFTIGNTTDAPINRPAVTNRGFGVLGFESGAHWLNVPNGLGSALSSAGVAEMFLVIKNLGNNTSGVWGSWNFGTTGDPGLFTWSGDGLIHETFGVSTGHKNVTPGVNLSLAWHVYDVFAGTNDYGVLLDTSSLYTDSTNSYGMRTTGILFGSLGGGLTLNSYIQEVVIFPSKLSSGDRALMNTYLTT